MVILLLWLMFLWLFAIGHDHQGPSWPNSHANTKANSFFIKGIYTSWKQVIKSVHVYSATENNGFLNKYIHSLIWWFHASVVVKRKREIHTCLINLVSGARWRTCVSKSGNSALESFPLAAIEQVRRVGCFLSDI